jgi:hypothetical protein
MQFINIDYFHFLYTPISERNPLLFEGSQTSIVCMEHWWNDTERKTEVLGGGGGVNEREREREASHCKSTPENLTWTGPGTPV